MIISNPYLRRILRPVILGALLFYAVPGYSQTPYLGEIRIFAGNFAPTGWAICDGSLLPISQNTALFSLLGTMYGGDGRTTFGLPDLRGRVPIGAGQGSGLTNRTQGEMGGEESHVLTVPEIPSHTHNIVADTSVATTDRPGSGVPARNAAGIPQYGTGQTGVMQAGIVTLTGGNNAHNNMQPYTTINYIIALTGVFPSRN
jgi:microcystin-dependent protein